MTLWSGRVAAGLHPAVEEFLRADDAELLPYDCAATAVHAGRLHAAGLLSGEERAEVEAVLADLEWEPGDEDVHTLIERSLGEVGRKLQAGRSRNDQVAAALRLYVVDACAEAVDGIEELARTLLDRRVQPRADAGGPQRHAVAFALASAASSSVSSAWSLMKPSAAA